MKKLLSATLILFLILCFSCKDKSKLGSNTSVEIINGVEYVHNTETPLHPHKTISFEEELSIGEKDEEGQIVLYRPGRFIVDEDENIYVCDRQDWAIKVFDPNGRFVRSIGREGSGPGEFKFAAEIAFLPDGRLLVQDWDLDRASLFMKDGQFISSHKSRFSSYDVYFTTNSSYARDDNIFGFEEKLFVKTYDFSGKELISFGEFTPDQSQEIKKDGRWFRVGKPFDVHSIVAGDQKNKRLYHCLNDKYLIEVYNQEGKLFRKIDRPYKLLPVTAADAQRWVEDVKGADEKAKRIIKEEIIMPKFKTVTERMIVDDLGNLWIETCEVKYVEGRVLAAYDIFNEKGVYEARIWSDLRPDVIFKGKMYRRRTDKESGYTYVSRYRIIWSSVQSE